LIKSKKLSKYKNISHGFFNKKGGKSNGIYKSLNCGIGSKDNKKRVKKNLEIVKNIIDKKAKNIFLLNQIHSNKMIYLNKNFKNKKKDLKQTQLLLIKRNFLLVFLPQIVFQYFYMIIKKN
tara:strand:+ start:586 stop:948 length:363 start_codon:yes stop_codon:yes gene_type:complete